MGGVRGGRRGTMVMTMSLRGEATRDWEKPSQERDGGVDDGSDGTMAPCTVTSSMCQAWTTLSGAGWPVTPAALLCDTGIQRPALQASAAQATGGRPASSWCVVCSKRMDVMRAAEACLAGESG